MIPIEPLEEEAGWTGSGLGQLGYHALETDNMRDESMSRYQIKQFPSAWETNCSSSFLSQSALRRQLASLLQGSCKPVLRTWMQWTKSFTHHQTLGASEQGRRIRIALAKNVVLLHYSTQSFTRVTHTVGQQFVHLRFTDQ